jgi:GH25 family lysozyme M1 (1,4-beta-N-acetylmuramidase)
MLKGIDVSSWQGDIQVQNMPVGFVIAKATEGVNYVNPYCDNVIQKCISSGKKWGFYHYAKSNAAQDEADYFINNCLNYFKNGIPVLDWEENQSVEWVNIFVNRIHERTGVWPWIYANPWRFNQGGVNPMCGRWVADYPDVLRPSLDSAPGEPPATDGLVCCWQYASDGVVDGYSGNLDVNHFFGDEKAWDAYSGALELSEDEKIVVSVLENNDYRVEIVKK